MGVNIAGLFPKKEISLDDLKGKIIVIDFMNVVFQFLASIRQRDGTPLMDSAGNITSHLQGLFNRSVSLLEKGIKPIFAFDEEDLDSMYKYSQQVLYLSPDMLDESKELLNALGIPYIEAPSEAEAQCAYICSKGDAYAVASQDADALLFGAPILVRNLTLAGSRKTGSGAVRKITPEMIKLSDVLEETGLDHEKLIILSILVGTDFNPKGVYGIGSKKALKLVKNTNDYDSMFDSLNVDFDWKEVYDVFENIPVLRKYNFKFGPVDESKLKGLLVDRHEFSETRVDSVLSKLNNVKKKGQKELFEF